MPDREAKRSDKEMNAAVVRALTLGHDAEISHAAPAERHLRPTICIARRPCSA
jgi:hypothetical protein